MTKYLLLLLLPVFATCKKDSANCFTAAGSTKVEIREFKKDLMGIEVGQRIHLELASLPSGRIEIEAPENFMKFIHAEVDEMGTLKIYETIGCGWNKDFDREIKVKVASGLSNLMVTVNGAARLFSDSLSVNKLTVIMKSTSPMSFNFVGTHLQIDHRGGGPITITGSTDVFVPTMYSAGKLDARDLKAQLAYVFHYGINEVHVMPIKELYAEIHNRGNVFYYSEPKDKPVQLLKIGRGNLIRVE